TTFGWSSVKIGTIQRRLAWSLRKDDTHTLRKYHDFLTLMPYLVNGQVVERRSGGFLSFFRSFFSFLYTFFASIFADQTPHSSTGGALNANAQKKWKYTPGDFHEGGVSRRMGSVKQQSNEGVPGCSSGG
ncbi:hypothetical protein WA577_000640, partial [Blastocystis sp. JDR]